MKLELKHLAAYLPYGIRMYMNKADNTYTLHGLKKNNGIMKLISYTNSDVFSDECKPILRPLSDMTKEIEINGEKFVPNELISKAMFTKSQNTDFVRLKNQIANNKIHQLPYDVSQILLSWHFDIFGLIDAGLAIDINTLKL